MAVSILVTGGAGFIGSHLVDALVEQGRKVRVLDNLDPQVHGASRDKLPPCLAGHIEKGRVDFQFGDVRDREAVQRSLEGIEVVFHQAAAVGVGQSMYQISDYVAANSLGAAVLAEEIVARRGQIAKVLVASSMSTYGEGKYHCRQHGDLFPLLRSSEQLRSGEWEMRCPECNGVLEAVPTDETKPLQPTSVYAITKRDHEELFLTVGAAYDIPTVALRYFNVYGPRQSLSNPYTGVGAIFTSRLLNGKPPLVFEDGKQSRDFIHVSDVVRANLLALEKREVDGEVFNVATGRALSLLEMVDALRAGLGGPEPEIIGKSRRGDIRHCYADVTKLEEATGFRAEVRFEDGIADLVAWAGEETADDRVEQAKSELENIGLTV
jgi:dTDP-L-rhamnose 4-epimerase